MRYYHQGQLRWRHFLISHVEANKLTCRHAFRVHHIKYKTNNALEYVVSVTSDNSSVWISPVFGKQHLKPVPAAFSTHHTHTYNINNKGGIYYWWQSTLPLIVPINYDTWELMVDGILIMFLLSDASCSMSLIVWCNLTSLSNELRAPFTDNTDHLTNVNMSWF